MRDDLRELEAALAGMAPAGRGLDRDRLMFEAGWAAAERALAGDHRILASGLEKPNQFGWHWRLASAAAVLVAAGLGWFLGTRSTTSGPVPAIAEHAPPPAAVKAEPATKVAPTTAPPARSFAAEAMSGSYFEYRNRLLELAAADNMPVAVSHSRAAGPSSSTAVEAPSEPVDNRTLMKQLLEEMSRPRVNRATAANQG